MLKVQWLDETASDAIAISVAGAGIARVHGTPAAAGSRPE
jgi:hypothetical protein